MDIYTVWVVQAYGEKVNDMLTDYVTLELIADSADSAIERAKLLITRNNYRISGVIDKLK